MNDKKRKIESGEDGEELIIQENNQDIKNENIKNEENKSELKKIVFYFNKKIKC